jgi:iron complex transport system ATP-binding protein
MRSRAPSILLSVRRLSVARGRATLLREVDWSVRRGEHWAVLGPNGCGKTSLLRALTGYLTPSAGEISLLGRRYGETDWRELRRRVGLVTSALQAGVPPAEPALETVISGKFAQLDLWAPVTRADRAAGRRWLRFTGCAALAEREWLYLSQGERQRVLIARALMARPQILILDEPCAGLDPAAREDFLGFLASLARRRPAPALVLVTHHVEEITPIFTHALVLKGGQALAAGPRRQTLTAAILGNAFGVPVRLGSRGGRLRLTLHPHRRRAFAE